MEFSCQIEKNWGSLVNSHILFPNFPFYSDTDTYELEDISIAIRSVTWTVYSMIISAVILEVVL